VGFFLSVCLSFYIHPLNHLLGTGPSLFTLLSTRGNSGNSLKLHDSLLKCY
jgi:hypothetical protein